MIESITGPDEKGNIQVPDELVPLFNKVATQIRFHTISGKNEVMTVADIVSIAQEFFQKHNSKQTATLKCEINNVRAELAVAKSLIAGSQATIKRKSHGLRRVMQTLRSLRQTVKRRRKHAK